MVADVLADELPEGDCLVATVAEVDALLNARLIRPAFDLARTALGSAPQRSAAAARLRLTMSTILVMSGHAGEAVELADSLTFEPDLPPGVLAEAELVRLLGVAVLDDLPRAQELAESILAGSDHAGTDIALATALTALAMVAWDGGRVADAVGLLRASVHRAELGPPGALRVYPRLRLATALTALGDFDGAEGVITATTDEIGHSGNPLWEAGPEACRAELQLGRGNLDEAAAEARRALALSKELGTPCFAPSAELVLAAVAFLRGDLTGSACRVDRFRRFALRDGIAVGPSAGVWIDARFAEARGDFDRLRVAMRSLDEQLSRHCRLLVDEPAAAGWLTRVALDMAIVVTRRPSWGVPNNSPHRTRARPLARAPSTPAGCSIAIRAPSSKQPPATGTLGHEGLPSRTEA